ncbi:MAG: YHS domain-containing protein [Bryobacteraceae bacterium]
MLRFVVYLLISILLISVLRSVIGVVLKGFADLFGPPQKPAGPIAGTPPNLPTGGELKKDPVCGTYIAIRGAVQKTMDGETYYFCSPECRDKFPLQRASR